jgi:hypothetical protein
MEIAPLPQLDEHSTMVAASADDVWAALLETLDKTSTGRGTTAFARLLGCEDSKASSLRPLSAGATIPGFRVTGAVPSRELALVGRHRFSAYALTFHIEPVSPTSTELRAESRAAFRGGPGRIYRLLVVSTGAHVFSVKRMLAAVRRRSE